MKILEFQVMYGVGYDEPIQIPAGAIFLSVIELDFTPYMQFLCDEFASYETRYFTLRKTGDVIYENRTYNHPFPGKFLGSFKRRDNFDAYHVFEL